MLLSMHFTPPLPTLPPPLWRRFTRGLNGSKDGVRAQDRHYGKETGRLHAAHFVQEVAAAAPDDPPGVRAALLRLAGGAGGGAVTFSGLVHVCGGAGGGAGGGADRPVEELEAEVLGPGRARRGGAGGLTAGDLTRGPGAPAGARGAAGEVRDARGGVPRVGPSARDPPFPSLPY